MILFDNHHLSSNRSIPELLKFGRKVGLRPEWLTRSEEGVVHFKITTEAMGTRVLKQGAVLKTRIRLFREAIRGDLPEIVREYPKRAKIQLRASNGFKTVKRRTTGEKKLFERIYQDCGGLSEITGKPLEFNVYHFPHVIAKGPNEKFRLFGLNIIHAEAEFHDLYDKGGKVRTLKAYPQAEWVYLLREWMLRKVNEN